jgi:hypothetical protein
MRYIGYIKQQQKLQQNFIIPLSITLITLFYIINDFLVTNIPPIQ